MQIIDAHPKLAREGWFYIGLTLVSAIVTTLAFPLYVSFLFWVIFVFVLQFFRDPYRAIPQQEGFYECVFSAF